MRSIAAILILFVPAQALADLIPPGTRNIPVEHRIETDQEHSGWAFFVVRGSGGVSKVTLDAKTPIVIPGSSAVGNGPPPGSRRGRGQSLIAPRRSMRCRWRS